MILDDGQGHAIDTESKSTLKDQIRETSDRLHNLKRKIVRMGRTKQRQQLQVQYDSLLVRFKKLQKDHEKETNQES